MKEKRKCVFHISAYVWILIPHCSNVHAEVTLGQLLSHNLMHHQCESDTQHAVRTWVKGGLWTRIRALIKTTKAQIKV